MQKPQFDKLASRGITNILRDHHAAHSAERAQASTQAAQQQAEDAGDLTPAEPDEGRDEG